jgi:putative membrane protein
MIKITEDDHARIGAAVARAETQTSGEIRCVLAAETVNGPFMAMIGGAAAALVAPPIAIALGLKPDMLTGLFEGWSAAHASAAGAGIYSTLTVYILLQAAIFLLVGGLLLFRPVRRLLTRGPGAAARVRRAALEQFEALGLTHTRDKTGVLIFASLDDHRAEVLADSGIYEKTTPQDWQCVVDALVSELAKDRPADGFTAAVGQASAILARHFPRKADDANELPNGLVTRKR